MAWEQLGKGQGYTGDEPIDAFAAALDRIGRAYQARFGRLPTTVELAHALNVTLGAAPDRYVQDPERLQFGVLTADDPGDSDVPIAPDDFSAAWIEDPQPDGTYLIERVADGNDVISATMKIVDRVLLIDYRILDPSLNDADARALIVATVLKALTRDAYAPDVDRVSFARTDAPGDRKVEPYPA